MENWTAISSVIASSVRPWQWVTFVACFICLATTYFGTRALAKTRFALARRLYWAGWACTTAFAVATAAPSVSRLFDLGAIVFLFGFLAVFLAFRFTNYLSFRGRVFADPSYSRYAPGAPQKKPKDDGDSGVAGASK